jgi:hypothetical protein
MGSLQRAGGANKAVVVAWGDLDFEKIPDFCGLHSLLWAFPIR